MRGARCKAQKSEKMRYGVPGQIARKTLRDPDTGVITQREIASLSPRRKGGDSLRRACADSADDLRVRAEYPPISSEKADNINASAVRVGGNVGAVYRIVNL
jgi:hypothetical protein